MFRLVSIAILAAGGSIALPAAADMPEPLAVESVEEAWETLRGLETKKRPSTSG